MKKNMLWMFLIVMACAGGNYRNQSQAIKTVTPFSAEKYLGTWYEIARFPNWFEKDCVGVTAQYTMREDGQIDVLNTCRKTTLDGEISTAKGIARIEGEGKLSVTFAPLLPFARGDYWVLGLQAYEIAVVGNRNGNTGWILSRSPSISSEEREWANGVLQNAGYDTSKLIEVLQ